MASIIPPSQREAHLPISTLEQLIREAKRQTLVNEVELSDSSSQASLTDQLPQKPKEDFEHEWAHFPTERSTVHAGDQRVYYPKKLTEVISWTDAFVDRIAKLTLEAEQDNYIKSKSQRDQIAFVTDTLEAEVKAHKKTEGELKEELSKEKKAHDKDVKARDVKISKLAQDNAELLEKVKRLQGVVDAGNKNEDLMNQYKTLKETYKTVQRQWMQDKAFAAEQIGKLTLELEQEKKQHDTDVKAIQKELMEKTAFSTMKQNGATDDKAKNELIAAMKLAERAQKTSDETAADLLKHLSTYDQGAIPPHPDFASSPIRIISVTYGPREYTWTANKTVFQTLYANASSKTKFTINAKLFGDDPWPSYKKTCAITYQVVKGAGLRQTLVGKEGDLLEFKGIPA